MPNQAIFVLDKASADAAKLATRSGRSRLEPALIESGPYAGQYMLPADVVNDPRYSADAKAIVTTTHALVVVDTDTLWPKDETVRKDEDAALAEAATVKG
jgi:hypothetical protein